MRGAAIVLVSATCLLIPASPGQERRVALVIGNSAYHGDEELKNPRNDALAIASRFERLGFEVLLKLDATGEAMDMAIKDFGKRLGPDAAGLFFYAGHGIRIDDHDYLLPIDYDRKGRDPFSVRDASVSAQSILDRMVASGSRLTLLILDACRNAPSLRSGGRGLSEGVGALKPAEGSAVWYATQVGATADDNRNGNNGMFTKCFLETLDENPGLSVGALQEIVAEKVVEASGTSQRPKYDPNIAGRFILNPGTPRSAPLPAEAAAAPAILELNADAQEIESTQSARINVKATDPNGEPLQFSWAVSGGRIESSGDRAVFTPERSLFAGGSSTARITVTARNRRGLEVRRDLLLRVRTPAPAQAGTPVGSVRSLGPILDIQLESGAPGPAAAAGAITAQLERSGSVWQVLRVDGTLPGVPLQLSLAASGCPECAPRIAEYPSPGNAFLRTRLQVRPPGLAVRAFTLTLSWQTQSVRKKGK